MVRSAGRPGAGKETLERGSPEGATQRLEGGHSDQVGSHDTGASGEGAVEVPQQGEDRHSDHGRVEGGEHGAQRHGGEHHALGEYPPCGACLDDLRVYDLQLSFSGRMRTMPASPSTSIICPFLIVAVAAPVPTTAGMRYSRATTAQWLRMPPVSVTTAAAGARRGARRGGGGRGGVHAGAVVSATSTSPSWSPAVAERDRSTLARPRTTPGEPGL